MAKNAKQAFKEVCLYYNDGGRLLMTDEQRHHFRALHKMWKTIPSVASEKLKHFHDMKQHHHFINAQRFDVEDSSKRWNNYIVACMGLRLGLLQNSPRGW